MVSRELSSHLAGLFLSNGFYGPYQPWIGRSMDTDRVAVIPLRPAGHCGGSSRRRDHESNIFRRAFLYHRLRRFGPDGDPYVLVSVLEGSASSRISRSRCVTTKTKTLKHGWWNTSSAERVEDPEHHNQDKERYNSTLSFRMLSNWVDLARLMVTQRVALSYGCWNSFVGLVRDASEMIFG